MAVPVGVDSSIVIEEIFNVGVDTAAVKATLTPGGYTGISASVSSGSTQWYVANYTTPYPPYFQNSFTLTKNADDGFWYGVITGLQADTTYYATPMVIDQGNSQTNNIHYGGEVSFSTQIDTVPVGEDVEPVDEDSIETVFKTRHRKLSFKIEKLDSQENVIEEKSVKLIDGKVDVGGGGFRRKASFSLLEPLEENWQSYRWKLYYGYSSSSTDRTDYFPLGVFIPVNPSYSEKNQGDLTAYQAVDKNKLFDDFQTDAPINFYSGTTVRDIILLVAGWFNETKFNIEGSIGSLEKNLTFEEGVTAESILNTLVSSFSAEWFYDAQGYLTARKVVDDTLKQTKYVMDDPDMPVYIDASTDIDDDNYYNRVTVIGGTVDTPIYRVSIQNNDAIARAGGRIVQKYFTIDAAVTQAQVQGRAEFYLSGGVQLPATLNLTALVIPDMEIGDVIEKDGVRYAVKSFSIPLGLGSQTVGAGRIFE